MEDLKKRKLDETAGNGGSSDSEENLRSLLEPLAKPHLVELLAKLGSQYPSIAEEIKSIASADPVHRKLFVRGLAWNTTSETLCAAFQGHGEIEEGAVIYDKNTGKSRGYGFITYKNIESTQIALRAPSKMIDGRMAVCNLACDGLTGSSGTPDLARRKLFIGGLSPDVSSEMLLSFFGRYGDIEEGSVAYDKDTTESRLSVSLHLQILIEIISVTFLWMVIILFLFAVGLDLLLLRHLRLPKKPSMIHKSCLGDGA
ncbi:hypothetical protein ACJRO7_029034 [Eucalyptus globulus]|uniref:RRM domain-containing protein n=1 Tax=Eucalyptus globulus TaxID=34317 RepID=A0ABD3K0B0_EUCGL